MLTRCPRCDTNFRVTPEQLKVRQGKVRCGSCQAVFNALETLVEEPPVATSAPVPAAALPEPLEEPREEPVPEQLYPEPAEPDAITELLAIELPESLAEPTLAEMSEEAAVEPEPAIPPEAPAEALVEAVAEPPPPPEPPTEPEAAPPEPEPAAPEPTPVSVEAGPAEEPWPGMEPLLHEDERPRRRWPWILGSLAGLLALTFQAAIHFRTELTVLAPESRPALAAACDLLGCELSLPRRIELIGIETSDLHPDPAVERRLTLTATLRNRAPFAQVWPHLELTLTDTDDRALIRRVLAPAEYLPGNVAPANGFAAGADQAIQLALDAKDVPAVGYRLYVFYP